MTADTHPMAPDRATTADRSPTQELLSLISGDRRVFDLAREYRVGMPQSPNHPAYWHTLPRRHGDMVRDGAGSAASDLIVTGTHVGTHIDALAHVSDDGQLFGGVDAAEAQVGGRFEQLGVHTIEPILRRGILLDIPGMLGVPRCDDGAEITVADLEATVDAQGTVPAPGDVLLVRSGWGRRWDEGAAFLGSESGVPGVGEAGATWLADKGAAVVGGDTIAFEHLAPGAGHRSLPAHRVLLVERGVPIIETMDLEALADADVHEFLFICTPLRLFGATGSPVRPLAVAVG